MPERPQRTNTSPGFRKRTPASKPPRREPEQKPDTAAVEAAHRDQLLQQLQEKYGQKLSAGQVKVEGATVRVGYLNAAAGLAFEIYPKRGGNNSGIRRKINSDVLRLSLLRHHWKTDGPENATCAIVLGDQAAVDDYLGKNGPSWARRAAELHGVEIIYL